MGPGRRTPVRGSARATPKDSFDGRTSPPYGGVVTEEAPREPKATHHENNLSSLRVLAHPLRLRMLSLLTGAALSATELGRELGVSQALASYHLRQLADAEVVELGESQ